VSIADDQRRHYRELLERYGREPRALGHRDRETQWERFRRLAALFSGESDPFTVHEIGAGLGDFGQFLAENHPTAVYSGSEICDEFVDLCRARFPGGEFHNRDVTETLPDDRYDYVTQSGTLNGRFGASPESWQRHVYSMLGAMYSMARKGIASNFLTTYHDPEFASEELHYQDENSLIGFVVSELSRHFELDMAGPLYEYTVRIHRPEAVRSRYPAAEFERYF
jgi:hypothetical protein